MTTTSGPAYQVVNPATGDVVETFDTATDADIEAAISGAAQAYASWKDVPITERGEIVKKVAALFAERADELAATANEEMGKPLGEGVEEAEFCQSIFDYFATEGPTLAADQPIKTFSGGKAVVQKLPVGPLLGIMECLGRTVPRELPDPRVAALSTSAGRGRSDRTAVRHAGS